VTGLERDLPSYLEIETLKLGGKDPARLPDAVAVEHYLTIEVAGSTLATLACTPADLEDLVAGFLVGQGVLRPADPPEKARFTCSFSPDRRVARVTLPARLADGLAGGKFVASGCGAGLAFEQARALLNLPVYMSDLEVGSSYLTALAALLKDSPLFQLTGGTHSALAAEARGPDETLQDPAGVAASSVVVRREDIGRHNAVDKVIGHLWLAGRLGRESFVLVTSGRMSSDIAIRAARAGILVVVSRGAPTVMAVQIANEVGVTLAGFARGRRLNVYGEPRRVSEQ